MARSNECSEASKEDDECLPRRWNERPAAEIDSLGVRLDGEKLKLEVAATERRSDVCFDVCVTSSR